MSIPKGITNVLLLDPKPGFLHRLSEQLAQAAQKQGEQYRVVPVESSEAALKELGRPNLSYWDMFLVNQDFLLNGADSPNEPSLLVEALRSQLATIPVAILSVDKITEADRTYKGLRMIPEGRPGYTTYIFSQCICKAPDGTWQSVQDSEQETTYDDVFYIIRARKLMTAMLRREGWLEGLARHGDIEAGISVVDYCYRLQYVNAQQRRISCRRDIQVGGICWMEYNPGFSLLHHCPWCPVAKARAARRGCSSTTISPSGCPHTVVATRRLPADLTSLAYRFFDVRAVPIPDPEEPFASGRSTPSTATPFVPCDFRSPSSFLEKLRGPEPLATYLWSRFSATACKVLSDPNISSEMIGQILAKELNVVLSGTPIYEEGGFKNVGLSDVTRQVLDLQYCEGFAVEVNRRFLEDAYPEVLLPRPMGTVELVSDCTAAMLERCRGAILQGKETFRQQIVRMLHRICDLGFDRARFWILNPDPQYLDGFACYPQDGHAREIVTARLDERTDEYIKLAKRNSGSFYCTGKECAQAPESARFRNSETPWLEVPLWARKGDQKVFVGKINLDNEPSLKSGCNPAEADLHRNKAFWPLLHKYAEMLGPVILEAREHWLREERARQTEELRALDLKLVQATDLSAKMQAIADCAYSLLGPDQCHIRFLRGDVLSLPAVAGKGFPGRFRDIVSVQKDKDSSVSAWFVNNRQWDQPLIFGPAKLAVIAANMRACGRNEAADYFESLKSCGAFGLLSPEKELLGVLVVDSKNEHYFDQERIFVAKDLVTRAQSLFAHHLTRERLQNLVNSLDSEVVVLGRNGKVLFRNEAWLRRAGEANPDPGLTLDTFSHVTRCSPRSASLFDKEVDSVIGMREPTRLVAEFDGPGETSRHMAVLIVPFERNALGGVETVLVVMSDIADLVSVESINEGALPHPDVGKALVEPLKGILTLFGAVRASVAECFFFDLEDSPIRVRCRVYDSGKAEAVPHQLPVIPQTGELLLHLLGYGYLAVTDVDSRSSLLNEEIRRMLRQDGIQSLLAAPIYISGKAWGVLTLLFKHRRNFSGQDVHLLRAATTQLSMRILLSQQAELRSMDRQIVEGISGASKSGTKQEQRRGLLDRILRQAIRLTGCDGGHIRVADWDRGALSLQAAENDPLVQPGMPSVRERLPLGEPVAGEVALTGERVIKSHRSDFNHKRLAGIPPNRTDVIDALEKEQSCACVPLVSGNETFGTATLTSIAPRFFEGRRLQLLDDFIQRASLALGAVRQMERLEEMSDEFGRVLNVELLDSLWQRITDLAMRLFLCEAASISSFNPATKELRREALTVMAGCEYEEQLGQTTTASDEPGCGLTRWVAKVGNVHRLEGTDAFNHPNLSKVTPSCHDRLPSGRFKSTMLTRLDTPEGSPMGILRVINRKGRSGDLGFTEFDEALMRLLSTKLAIAIERLKLLESRNRSVATTAHDLKTPLQNIRVTLDGFLEGAFRMPDDAEQMRMSYNSCKLLDAFILSTIEVAQGKFDRARVQVEGIDAQVLVDEALEVLKPKFHDPQSKEHPWKVITTILPGAEQIWGDRQRLLRLLLNLCHNAWKHGRATKKGLESGAQQNQVEITVRCDGDISCLRVADRGPGLAGARELQVTEALLAHGDRGQGVGLASGHLVAEAHNGQLVCADRADEHSGFQAELAWNQEQLRELAIPAQ